MKPYRTPATTPPRELVFEPAALAATVHSRLVAIPVLGAAVVVALVARFLFDRLVGLLGFLGTLLVGFLLRRTPPSLVLRVENAVLTVTRGNDPLLASSLEDLHDVALDTRAIRPVGWPADSTSRAAPTMAVRTSCSIGRASNGRSSGSANA